MAEVLLRSPNQKSASLKYHRIAEELKDQITRGVLSPGDRLPSYAEMRARFETTQSTIEKTVALLEQEKLIVRRPSSGIYVAPKTDTPENLSGTVGLLLPRFHFPQQSVYWLELLQSVRDAAQQHESHVLLLDDQDFRGWEKADGVLLCGWNIKDAWQMLPANMPCVSMLAPLPERASVVADDYQGGQLATEHLLELGHRRIAYLHNVNQSVVNRRRDGYRDALLKASVEPELVWERTLSGHMWLDGSFEESGYQAMRDWLRGSWSTLGCTALLAHNDEVALGAIRALQEMGLNVPEDVSVVGFDGTQRAGHHQLQLTTIEVPLKQIGATALELLLQQIYKNQTQTNSQKVLSVQLRIGNTTAPLHIEPNLYAKEN